MESEQQSDTLSCMRMDINKDSGTEGTLTSGSHKLSVLTGSPEAKHENASLILSPRGSAMRDRDLRFKYISAIKNNQGHLANRQSFLKIPEHMIVENPFTLGLS